MSPRLDSLREAIGEPSNDSSVVDVIDDLAHLLDAIPDRTRFLDAFLQTARRAFMADHGAIVSYHAAFDTWYVESWYGFTEDPKAEEEIKQYSKTILKETYEHGAIVMINDAGQDALTRDSRSIKRYNIKSVLCAPFWDSRGNVLGVIYLDSSSVAGAFDETSRERLAKLARFCGLAVQRCRELGPRALPATLPTADAGRDSGIFDFRSPAMRKLMADLERATQTDAPILLLGENGVGKDYLARWIHQASQRREGPFIPINLPELSTELLESELFGIEAKAASGVDGSDGLIRIADGGTVYLNEIAELPLSSQVKLLGVLESRSVRRVKGREPFPVNVRYVSATNQDLGQLMAKNRFRRDLYYRINVVEIIIPPLRERPEDIEPLAVYLLKVKCEARGRPPMRIPKTVMSQMQSMPWNGNIRELANVIERVVMNHDGDEFPPFRSDGSVAAPSKQGRRRSVGRSLKDQLLEYEKELVESALQDSGWVQVRAAGRLRISEASLRDKMKRLEIRKPRKI